MQYFLIFRRGLQIVTSKIYCRQNIERINICIFLIHFLRNKRLNLFYGN